VFHKKIRNVGIMFMCSVLLLPVVTISNTYAYTNIDLSDLSWDKKEDYYKAIFDNPNTKGQPQPPNIGAFKIADFYDGNWNVEISPKDVSNNWNVDDKISIHNPGFMKVTMRDNLIILSATKEDYPEPGNLWFEILNETRNEVKPININLSMDERPTFRSYSDAYRFIESIPRIHNTSEDIIVTGDQWIETDDYGSPGTISPTEEEWNDYISNPIYRAEPIDAINDSLYKAFRFSSLSGAIRSAMQVLMKHIWL